MPEFVRQHIQDEVATITIDRPDVHNAFNEVVIEELTAAFLAAGARSDTRVVILASTGKSFSAGADINWMKRMVDYTIDENIADATDMCLMLRAIRECPKPVIARIHGAAYGGGVGLAASCDLAFAVRTATFALTEVRLGIVPAVISPFVQEKIGPGALRRFALTAERFDADEAYRIGLVTEVQDTVEALDERIAWFSRQLRKNGPEALAECKKVLRRIQSLDSEEATVVTTRFIAERRVSGEGQDGLHAFLEKRAPGWESREASE